MLPSYGEPAAYSIVEAMANGLAVICSSQNGTRSYIHDGQNGYVFEAKNLNDLKQKLELLISNREKLVKMQKNALSLAIVEHSLEGFCNRVCEITLTKNNRNLNIKFN